MKYLLLLLAIFVVYWLVKAHQRKKTRTGEGGSQAAEDMVQCAHCGLHLPRSDSLPSGAVFYCTPEHRRLHQQGK